MFVAFRLSGGDHVNVVPEGITGVTTVTIAPFITMLSSPHPFMLNESSP